MYAESVGLSSVRPESEDDLVRIKEDGEVEIRDAAMAESVRQQKERIARMLAEMKKDKEGNGD